MKRLLLIFLCLLLMFSVTACKSSNINNAQNITMVIKNNTLTNTGATIIITDNSNQENMYGEWYRIDKKVNDNWQELKPVINNYGFSDIGYLLDEANNKNKLELNINWEWLYGKLPAGEYRIVKKVNDNYINTEFTIK